MNRTPDPVNVLYIANAAQIGGGNRSLIDLILGLDRTRFEPFLVVPGNGPMVGWAEHNAIRFAIVPPSDWSGLKGLLRRTTQLFKLMRQVKPRIVHAMAPTCYRAAGVAARFTGARRVCHLGYPPVPGELEWSFQVQPDVVIGCHQGQAEAVSERVRMLAPAARVTGIVNGIDVARFTPARDKDARARRRPVVLIVGHLSAVKGYPTFFEAAARIVAAGHDCSFVALGGETASAGYQKVLEALVGRLGLVDRVEFLGWRSDVDAIMRSVDVMVLPSHSEGLPLAILEGMASGLPIVATSVGGVPEAIIDGETGLLIPSGDVDALTHAVTRLLDDPELAARIGRNARVSAEQQFSIARFVSDVECLYDELL